MAIISNGTTIADAGAFSASLGALVHIKTITLSSAAGGIAFVDGSSSVVLDDTYPIYKFEMLNLHPSASSEFEFNMSIDTGSNYNATKTTTSFYTIHAENGSQGTLYYVAAEDTAQGTGYQNLHYGSQLGTNNDCCFDGELYLFNPSSTTFVKQFMARGHYLDSRSPQYTYDCYTGGYINSTSAVDAVRFQMGSGNLDAGIIKLYGIKDS